MKEILAKLSDDAPPYQGNNAEWWNAEVAPHFREILKLVKESSSSATKIREEIRTMEREGGELEPYLEVVKTKNMDKMFDYAYEKARRDILALLPSEGESNHQ